MILGYKIIGSGDTNVIMMHDWLGDCRGYEYIFPYMDVENYTYALVDLRGYGRSKEIQGRYDCDEALNDILILVESLGWKDFHIIAYSMSINLARKLQIENPHYVNSIIAISPVIATSLEISEDELKNLEDAANQNDEAALNIVRFMTSNSVTEVFAKLKVRKWRESALPQARIGYLDMMTKMKLEASDSQANLPLLVIEGANDATIYRQAAQELAKLYPKSQLKLIENAGHYPLNETPVLMATYIEQFLKQQIKA